MLSGEGHDKDLDYVRLITKYAFVTRLSICLSNIFRSKYSLMHGRQGLKMKLVDEDLGALCDRCMKHRIDNLFRFSCGTKFNFHVMLSYILIKTSTSSAVK